MFIRLKKKKILSLLIVFYVILQTGSAYQNVYMSELATINMLLGFIICCLLGIQILQSPKKLRCNASVVFILYLIANMAVLMILWDEYDLATTYLSYMSYFIVAIWIARNVDYDSFVVHFVYTMLILALISLFCFYIHIFDYLPAHQLEGTFSYNSIVVYFEIIRLKNRNCGFFWEPGMYQGLIVAAMIFLILKKDLFKRRFLKLIIFAVTLISTYSTTAYVLIFAVAILFIIDISENLSKVITNILAVSAILLLLLAANSGYIMDAFLKTMPSVITQKIVEKNVSYNTRMYSMIFDLIASIRHPLGIGRSFVNDIIWKISSEFNIVIDARTNTTATAFVHFGILGGIFYLYIWVKGCFSIAKSFITKTLIFAILFVIINTEPHLYTLLFNVLIFYWFDMRTEAVSLKEE